MPGPIQYPRLVEKVTKICDNIISKELIEKNKDKNQQHNKK